jgi:hypothetical protein
LFHMKHAETSRPFASKPVNIGIPHVTHEVFLSSG